MEDHRSDAEELFAFLDDLEGRAASLVQRERADEVRDRSRRAYAEVSLEARLMASLDREVSCVLAGRDPLRGRVQRVGAGWFVVAARQDRWFVRLAGVVAVRGLSTRAVPVEAWRRSDRLGFEAVLRRLGDEGAPVSLHLVDGSRRDGVVARVGADFVEVDSQQAQAHADDAAELVVTAGIVAVQCSAALS